MYECQLNCYLTTIIINIKNRAKAPNTFNQCVRCFYIFAERQKGEDESLKFISDNWQIITAFLTSIAYLYRQVVATRKGVRALLRADLIRLYNKYHDDLGYCPVYVKQSLEDEYQQYHALRGNGVGTNLYNALMALPTEPQEGD